MFPQYQSRQIKPRFEWHPRMDSNHPLSIGCVGLWLLNETGGLSAYDLSGNDNHGTLTNGPTWASGRTGQALSFDGVDDYVNMGNGSSLNVLSGQGFTVSGWVKTTDNYGQLVSLRNSADDYPVFDLSIGYNGVTNNSGNFIPLMRYDGKTGLAKITSSENISNGIWHFVAAVLDQSGDTFKAYVDANVYSVAQTVDGSITTQEDRAIGAERKWVRDLKGTIDQQYLIGLIDEVHIYNRALSMQEIQWLYQFPYDNLIVEPLRKFWFMPEAAGQQFQQALSGAVSFGGAILKQTGRSLMGSLSSTGIIAKQTSRILAGTISFAGVLSSVKTILKSLAGALSFSGALSRQAGKSLTGAISFSGSIQRNIARILSGAISFAGALSSVKTILKLLAGALSFSGALSRQTGKSLIGSLSFTGSIQKNIMRILSGGISFIGNILKETRKQLAGQLSFSGTVSGIITVLLKLIRVIFSIKKSSIDFQMKIPAIEFEML